MLNSQSTQFTHFLLHTSILTHSLFSHVPSSHTRSFPGMFTHTHCPPSPSHLHRTSEEEKLKFEQERAEELYKNMRRAKMVAKKRSEEMSKMVEVCVYVWGGEEGGKGGGW